MNAGSDVRLFPFDIFHILNSLLDRKTLLSLIRTCRTYHEYGVVCLFEGKVVLYYKDSYNGDGRDNIVSFCSFMLANPSLRIPMLRKLTLRSSTYYRPIEGHVKLLAQVLSQASNLEELDLTYIDVALMNHPELVDAIVSLPSVKYLKMSTEAYFPIGIIEKMRSPLVKASIKSWSVGWKAPMSMALDPLPLLQVCANTLQELELSNVKLWKADIVFPHVHSLHLRSCFSQNLQVLVTSFPNLRHLTADNDSNIETILFKDNGPEHMDEVCKKNWVVEAWPRLESLSGTPSTLYVFGVSSSIGRLYISRTGRARRTFIDINHILRFTQADTARIEIDSSDAGLEIVPLLVPTSAHFSRLEFCVSPRYGIEGLSPAQTMEQIYKLVDSLSVSSLQIVISCSGYCPGAGSDRPHKQFLVDLDLEVVARRLATNMPALMHVFLQFGCSSESSMRCWEVVGDDEDWYMQERDAALWRSVTGDLSSDRLTYH